MKTPREMTATEVAARDAEARGKGRRTYPPTSGLYDQTDVDLHGATIAAGHNPDGVTVVQVGAGWRLLAPEEICGARARTIKTPYRKNIQAWEAGRWDTSGWTGDSEHHTYRTAKPPGLFLPAAAPHTTTAEEVAATWVDEKVREAIGAAAAPAPDARRYVHPFVCNACPRTCTMETVTVAPGPLVPGSFDMQCPFRRPEFVSLWKAGPVQTLTP